MRSNSLVPKTGVRCIQHHSDRGIQYASGEYVAILRKHEIVPSMSRPANPYDNASCESFIKTLKREEIYANEYRDLEHLRSNIEEFIERYYNQKRLHSALGYRSPEEFEQQATSSNAETTLGSTVRFFQKASEGSSTSLIGEGTQAPSLPLHPIPAEVRLTIPITSATISPPASLRSDDLIGIAGMLIAFTSEP